MESLVGKLLVARPGLRESIFARSLVIICSHDAQGAWGLIVNSPIENTERCTQVWDYLGYSQGAPFGMDLWLGGPVLPDRVIVMHDLSWRGPATQPLVNNLGITQDPSIFQALHHGHGPRDYKIFLGFAAWSPGQLEGELGGQAPWTVEQSWLISAVGGDEIMSVDSQEEQWFSAVQGVSQRWAEGILS